MANRYGYEEEPGRWEQDKRGNRGRWRDMEYDEYDTRESLKRPGGGYGIGGAERGYNMGGYGGMGSYEQGYSPRSYDRMLGLAEGYYGAGNEDYGRAREEDERYWFERNWGKGGGYAAGAAGLGQEPFGDEWRGEERSTGQHWGREELRRGSLEWTARSRGLGKAPKGYTRSDERIREDICERLMNSPYDASDVEVSVKDGEVTLTGQVRHRAEKWGIEDVIEGVVGVHDVHNQVRIQRGEVLPPTDDTRHFHS